ncbi:hypothetical protein ACOZFM_02205 [Streptomyces arboris]
MQNGRHTDSIRTARKAIALHRSCGNLNGEGKTLLVLAASLRSTGSIDEAVQALEKASSAFEETNDQENLAVATRGLTEIRRLRET